MRATQVGRDAIEGGIPLAADCAIGGIMAYAVGIALALLTGLFTRLAGLDRDRALYPVLLVVIASYYVLFAAMGGSAHTVLVESLFMTVFAAIAVVGFKRSLWLIVAALAGHGVFDFIHGRLVTNPGVPGWWPPFCLAFDVAFAAFLAWLLRSRRLGAAADRRVEPWARLHRSG